MLHENKNEKSARQNEKQNQKQTLHENKNEKSARQNEKQIQNRNVAWKQKSKRQTKVHAAWIIKNANQKVRTSKVKRLRTQKVQTQTSSQKKFSKELPSNLPRELEALTSFFNLQNGKDKTRKPPTTLPKQPKKQRKVRRTCWTQREDSRSQKTSFFIQV